MDIPKIKNRRSYPNIKPYQLWFCISLFKIWFVRLEDAMSKGETKGINNKGERISLPLDLENKNEVIVPTILNPNALIIINIINL